MDQAVNKPKGIGGWLILPAIGIILTPLRLLYLLATVHWPLFQDGTWELVTTPGTEFYHELWGPLLVFEIAGNIALLGYSLVLIHLFFTKSYRLPFNYIIFLICALVFVITDHLLFGMIPMEYGEADIEGYSEILRTLLATVIWVPYFLRSERVKNTFVKPPDNPMMGAPMGQGQIPGNPTT